jgi:hypothetical protein
VGSRKESSLIDAMSHCQWQPKLETGQEVSSLEGYAYEAILSSHGRHSVDCLMEMDLGRENKIRGTNEECEQP